MKSVGTDQTLTEKELDSILDELADLLFEKWLAETSSTGNINDDEKRHS